MKCGSCADNAAHRAWEDDAIWQLIGGVLGTGGGETFLDSTPLETGEQKKAPRLRQEREYRQQ